MKTVRLPMSESLKQRFDDIWLKFEQGSSEKLSKPLGDLLADLSCEMLDRLFGDLLRLSKQNAQDVQQKNMIADSEKVVQQIHDTFKKYMPYSVSLFGNDRLRPMVGYLYQQILKTEQQAYLTFEVPDQVLSQALDYGAEVKQGERQSIIPAFDGLIKIIDEGVTSLIRQPKDMLKFNFVIDKTLTGVLNMTTNLGYKRLEKLATQMDTQIAARYVDHFTGFVQK